MTKSIEEQREELAKKYVSLSAPEMTRLQMSWDFKNGFDAGAKTRDEQWQAVVNELREVRRPTTSQLKQLRRRIELLEKRISENPNKEMGFDKAELSAIETLFNFYTKADQMLKDMGIK